MVFIIVASSLGCDIFMACLLVPLGLHSSMLGVVAIFGGCCFCSLLILIVVNLVASNGLFRELALFDGYYFCWLFVWVIVLFLMVHLELYSLES